MVFPDHSVHFIAKPYDDVAQYPVVHIQAALPHHLPGVDLQRVSLLDVVVQHSRQQVVCGGNGMEIPCEMQVQIFHRNHLRIAAAGRPSLNPEAGPKGRFTERDDGIFSQFGHGLPQADGCGGLALSGRGGIDGCHKNQLPVLIVLDLLPEPVGKLCLVLSVKLQVFRRDPRSLCDLCNWLHHCFLCNLNICLHSYPS